MATEVHIIAPGDTLIITIEGVGTCYEIEVSEVSFGGEYVNTRVTDMSNDTVLDENTFSLED